MLSVLSEKNVIPPYGVEGGKAGASNRFFVIRGGETVEPSDMPGKVSGFRLEAGDIVREETAGGGGHGDPLSRDPELVREDVVGDYLTPGQAERRYGVVLGPDLEVDTQATRATREALAAARPRPRIEAANEEMFDGTRRRVIVPARIAEQAGIADGALVEISTGRGAPLRAWARIAEEGSAVLAGASSLAIVRASPGDRIEISPACSVPEL